MAILGGFWEIFDDSMIVKHDLYKGQDHVMMSKGWPYLNSLVHAKTTWASS